MAYRPTGLGETQAQLRERARALYTAGQEAFDSGRFRESLTSFEQAYRAYSNPTVLVAIAWSKFYLGDLEGAEFAARDYLRRDPEGAAATKARGVLKSVAAERAPVAQPDLPSDLTPRAASSEIPRDAYSGRSTVGVWAATGAGVLGLIGLGWYLSRPKKVASNRHRRRTSRRA